MFSSALKSFSSTNISSNYTVSPNPTSTAGPWKIYDAKKKSTGKAYSVFAFDKKSLDAHGSSVGKGNAASYKRSVEEVVERLKKEASSWPSCGIPAFSSSLSRWRKPEAAVYNS